MKTTYNFNNITGIFETERLWLRQFAADDLDFVFRQFSDPDMCKYFNVPPCPSLDNASGIIKNYANPGKDPQFRWVLVRKSDNATIGTCGYHCFDKDIQKAEIGYDVWKDFWKQGYMSEALPVLLSLCFDHLGLNKVYAKLDPENTSSRKTAEKAGFKVDGIMREDEKIGDRYIDLMYMSLLRREWMKRDSY